MFKECTGTALPFANDAGAVAGFVPKEFMRIIEPGNPGQPVGTATAVAVAYCVVELIVQAAN